MANRVTALLQRLFRWGPKTAAKTQKAGPGKQVSPLDTYRDMLKLPRDRNKVYDLYEELDEIPEVSSVLDAYAEDSTQYDKEKQASIWTEGSNAPAVDECNALLKRLEVEEWIEGLARDLAKNGDDFGRPIFHDPDKSPEQSRYGVMGIEWTDPRWVERVEDDNSVLLGFVDSNKLGGAQLQAEDMYKPWEFIHWRIRTRKYVTRSGGNIYGTSLLRNAARPGKQMKMLDDMLMVLRAHKCTDKRMYEIDVGNAAPEEYPGIMRDFQSVYSRAHWRDLLTGEVSNLYDPMAMDDDIYFPKRHGSESKVSMIPANPDVRDLADVDHKRNQLFGSMRAPKNYFGFEGDVDARQSVSSADIRFARLCKKLQRAIIAGFTRLFEIHLTLVGIPFKRGDFRVMMVEPSAIEHVHRLETTQVLIDIAERTIALGDSIGLDPVGWRMHVLRKVLGFTDVDLKAFFRQDQVKPGALVPGGNGVVAPEPTEPAEEPSREQLQMAVRQAIADRAFLNEGRDQERPAALPGHRPELPRSFVAGKTRFNLTEGGGYAPAAPNVDEVRRQLYVLRQQAAELGIVVDEK